MSEPTSELIPRDDVSREVAVLDALLRDAFWRAMRAPSRYDYNNDWQGA